MAMSIKSRTGGPTLEDLALTYGKVTELNSARMSRVQAAVERWVIPIVGEVSIEEFSSDHRRLVVDHFMRAGVIHRSPNILDELRHVLKGLHNILKFGVRTGVLARLPYESALIEDGTAELWVVPDLFRYLGAVDHLTNCNQVRLAIRMFLFLGLRVSELARMRWGWFTPDLSGVAIMEPDPRNRRYLPIPSFLVSDLAIFRQELEAEAAKMGKPNPPWVFFNGRGMPHVPNRTRTAIQLAALLTGMEGVWNPQALRASSCTLLCEMGASRALIRWFFGMWVYPLEPEFTPDHTKELSAVFERIGILFGLGASLKPE